MPTDIETLRAEVAELRAEIRKPKHRKDRRILIGVRMNNDELAIVDAACRDRGLCRADLVRIGLSSVIGQDLRIKRDVPEALRRFTVRHKPDHFSDQKTSVTERAHAMSREDAGRKAMMLNMEAKAILRARDAPTIHTAGMIADSRTAPLSGKLSR